MQLKVGQTAVSTRVFSQEDFDRFAALSGDDNPIHVDPVFSAGTHFGRTVCHGMLLYSVICQTLSAYIPGVVQHEQTLKFTTPTFTGEPMTIRLAVAEVQADQGTALVTTTISHEDGQLAVEGQTLVSRDGRALGDQREAEETHPPSEAAPASQAGTFKGLRLGQKATIRRVFSTADLAEYADLSGDDNPLFSNADYARRVGLDGPMIPGGLLGGLFSDLLGTELPGRGTNWLKQRLAFHRPAYPGQALTAEVEIIRLRPEKELVNLRTRCANAGGQVVCSGEALVLIRSLEKAPAGNDPA